MVMRVKELRMRAGLTQTGLATQMGVGQNSVSNWETETVLPKTRELPQLAKLLGCSMPALAEILGRREPRK